ncbi:flagellar assembly peptidoglycan hydrolase FlgJ [Oxalicibacterium solurbis]|uniref:Peptidoglycan hydrolase FlgJ n=1 Tax=Oxalicibacterium solurbis TaxID=69280 RepID=A0A8J3ATT3_9BURK|nr:flagellar assembly peptidoglycan hydrolase FlgJ [Oxalicibacterium solurbis]GGI53050.1 flagellar rod assembly protein/muramidase FlgJ [Oxalicibacterium solurbis]
MSTSPIDSANNLAIDANSIESLKIAARKNSPEALKATAKQFEALFVNMMMKSMREATPQDGMFDTQQTKMYQSMLDQQLSQNMASRGIGLADVLIRQLSNLPGNAVQDDAAAANGDGQPQDLRTSMNNELLRSLSPRAVRTAQTEATNDVGDAGDASRPAHVQAFQNALMPHAQAASRTTGIPAKFMLGQAALESGWGKHVMKMADGSSSHNLFGIKASANWKGKTVDAVTTEYVNGVPQKRVEKFRAYDSYADSFRDYANLLRSNPRYEKVLANATDVHGFAQGLQRAGYATDPNYAAKLTNIINNKLSV